MDMASFAVAGLVQIILSLLFIALSWWSLQNVRWDIFLAKPNSPQAKALVIILSIILGSLLAKFFSDYFGWSNMMRFFF